MTCSYLKNLHVVGAIETFGVQCDLSSEYLNGKHFMKYTDIFFNNNTSTKHIQNQKNDEMNT